MTDTVQERLPARLHQPWAGFSRIDIGPFIIGIAVTNEDGKQDPEAAGAALKDFIDRANADAETISSLIRERDALKVKEEKRAPVQGFSAGIPWSMHLRAYDAYCKQYSRQQALIEGGCRGGFGVKELDDFIPGWREEISEIARLTRERDEARATNKRLSAIIEAERAQVAERIEVARKAITSREWLCEGRGPYAWDDDDYRREFRAAADDFLAALAPLKTIAKDRSDCPSEKAEIVKARALLSNREG